MGWEKLVLTPGMSASAAVMAWISFSLFRSGHSSRGLSPT